MNIYIYIYVIGLGVRLGYTYKLHSFEMSGYSDTGSKSFFKRFNEPEN